MITIVIAMALSTGVSPIPDDSQSLDARCVIVFSLIAKCADPKALDAGRIGLTHFLAKLTGRIPTLDVESTLHQAAPFVVKRATEERLLLRERTSNALASDAEIGRRAELFGQLRPALRTTPHRL